MKRLLAATLVVAILAVFQSTAARADMPVIDISNLLKQAEEIQHQLQILEQTKQQVVNSTKQLQSLPANVWARVQQNVQALTSLVGQDKYVVLNSTNASSQFQNLFPGYAPPRDFGQAAGKWYYATMDATTGVIRTANAILGQQGDDMNALSQAQANVDSGVGEKAVLQASATIAAQQVEQLHKLLTLASQENAAEGVYRVAAAAQAARKDAQTDAVGGFLQGKKPLATPQPRGQ